MEKDISNLQKDSNRTLIPIFVLVGGHINDMKTLVWGDY